MKYSIIHQSPTPPYEFLLFQSMEGEGMGATERGCVWGGGEIFWNIVYENGILAH